MNTFINIMHNSLEFKEKGFLGKSKRARGQEGKRARGQEGKRARGQEGKGKRARGQGQGQGQGQRCGQEAGNKLYKMLIHAGQKGRHVII